MWLEKSTICIEIFIDQRASEKLQKIIVVNALRKEKSFSTTHIEWYTQAVVNPVKATVINFQTIFPRKKWNTHVANDLIA